MKKKILSLALSLTLMAGLAVPVRAANEEPTFTDVPATRTEPSPPTPMSPMRSFPSC